MPRLTRSGAARGRSAIRGRGSVSASYTNVAVASTSHNVSDNLESEEAVSTENIYEKIDDGLDGKGIVI